MEREDDSWKFAAAGTCKEPPEVAPLWGGQGGPMMIYYDLHQLSITSKASGKALDLRAITPTDWNQRTVRLTSGAWMPPEVHQELDTYHSVDVGRKEVVTGTTAESEELTPEQVSKAYRFLAEVGEPVDEESARGLGEAVLAKRTEVLDALEGKTDGDPQQLAIQPFLVSQ